MGNEVVRRLLLITAVISLIAYGAYLFFASSVQAETEKPLITVEVYDFIDSTAKTHRLSGIIMVPTACHEIHVKTEEKGPGIYHLYFTTFGDVHGCAPEPEPRAFRTVVPAPLVGVRFTASLDWHPLDFIIVSQARS